jgi:undecaprenyl phosphate N,N'-diacetylbacillosamine 1-phosphate transferase
MSKSKLYSLFIKRLIDLLAAIIVFALLLPVFFITMGLLFFINKGAPFFIQKRPGKDGKIFKMIKFKTMNDLKDEQGNLLLDEERLTGIGKFVRKTSIDEIPQLLNIIKGEMSLVGPRPLLVEYLELYNPEQKRRHEVKPGVTGWAQINGRNAISWNKKLQYDVWYVNHVNFALDMKIICKTIVKIFKSEGISSPTSVTMEKFTGNL